MSRNKTIAYRLRWLLLILGIVFTFAGIVYVAIPALYEDHDIKTPVETAGLVGTPWMLILGFDRPYSMSLDTMLFLGVFFLSQWFFLRPKKNWVPRLLQDGRPLKSSAIAAGIIAMLLSFGAIATLLEIVGLWDLRTTNGQGVRHHFFLTCWIIMILLWAFWSVVFLIYWRGGDRYQWMNKIIRALVAGSLLELFVTIPAHIYVTRQDDCYCCRGTYTGLVFGGTVLIWTFGPGVVLLFAREKYRLVSVRLNPRCTECGYELRGTIDAGKDICPECGAAVDVSAKEYEESSMPSESST